MNYYLHILTDTYSNGYFSLILDMLSYISIILAILVITTKNPVISVLFLIGLFFSIACYLISTGVTFIGISYLLVYVGAVSILFLFILMLINIRVSELITETKNSIPLVFLVALIFEIAYYIIFPQKSLLHDSFINTNTYKLNIVTYNNWENTLTEFNHVISIGNIMYTNYSILLLLTSIILLLAMVGAIVITIKQKTTIYEEKAVSLGLHEPYLSTNSPLQSNVSISMQRFTNYIFNFVKYIMAVVIKLFTLCFFMLSAVIWYNCASDTIYNNTYYNKILFSIIMILSFVVLYLIIMSINKKHNIKFMDKIRALYKNKWLIILLAIILIIPRRSIFALADVSLQDPCYIPCIVFIVLVTSIPITWIVILSVNLYKKNSFKISILHATYAINQLNYIHFFSLIVITCLICTMKILFLFIILPSYVIPNFNSIASIKTTENIFETYSPIEKGEGKGKGKRMYDPVYDLDSDVEHTSKKAKTSNTPITTEIVTSPKSTGTIFRPNPRWIFTTIPLVGELPKSVVNPPRNESVTPVNDPEEVAKALKVMEKQRWPSDQDKDPTKFYWIEGKICSLTKAGVILGYTDMLCPSAAWANRAPFYPRDCMIKDVNNNIIGDVYEGEVRTVDGRLVGATSWSRNLPYGIYANDGLGVYIHPNSNLVFNTYHWSDRTIIIGRLCREGHIHDYNGRALGVLHCTFVYHAFSTHNRVARLCVPGSPNNKSAYTRPPANLKINELHRIGPYTPFKGVDLKTRGTWPPGSYQVNANTYRR